MNKTLIREDEKLHLQDTSVPALSKRHKQATKTIKMTNNTLQNVAKEIETLTNFVSKLKQRIGTFETLNISSSEIETNLTFLENRLSIMKQHYINVQEIVDKFEKDLNTYNGQGENITIDDVNSNLTSFNKTLEMVESVLSKIDLEAFEIDDHLFSLNATMKNTNDALDVFEEQLKRSNKQEEIIREIGVKIEQTTNTIEYMRDSVKRLNQSYSNMQVVYKNVLDTAKNNTIVKSLLLAAEENIDELSDLLDIVKQQYNTNLVDFSNMNETLLRSISTYAELIDTLTAVQKLDEQLRSSINEIEHQVLNAANETSRSNNSITHLTTVMDNLNTSLHQEQVKYDFLQNNYGNLTTKLDGLKSPMENANATINNMKDLVAKTDSSINKLAQRFKTFNNILIPINTTKAELGLLDESIRNSSGLLNSLMADYNLVRTNISELTDKTKNISEVMETYDAMNGTLDDIIHNLTDINASLTNVETQANLLTLQSQNIERRLDHFDKLFNKTSGFKEKVTDIGNAVNSSNTHIEQISQYITNSLEKLTAMKVMYKSIHNKTIQNDLDELLKNMSSQSDMINIFRNNQTKISDDFYEIESVYKDVLRNMQQPIEALDKFDNILSITNDSLSNLSKDIDSLIVSKTDLQLQTETTGPIIADLEKRIQQLNETMQKEQVKRDFITVMYPIMLSQLNNMSRSYEGINATLIHVENVITITETHLNSVTTRINGINAIQIPVNDEEHLMNMTKQVQINNTNIYNTITDRLKALNIERLKDTSLTMDELQSLYDDFQNESNTIRDAFDKIKDNVFFVEKTTRLVNETVTDVNKTLDNFMEMEKVFESVINVNDKLEVNFSQTNQVINNLSNEINSIYELFNTMVNKFQHLNDSKILSAKDAIRIILEEETSRINTLKQSMQALQSNKSAINSTIRDLDQTLYATKMVLEQLKDHILNVNATAPGVVNSLVDASQASSDLNSSAHDIIPQLHYLLTKVKALNIELEVEQEKIEFLRKNKPMLSERLKYITDNLESTNKNITLVDVNLSDLKIYIRNVGERLATFKQLDITTSHEMDKWTVLHSKKENLLKTFSDISNSFRNVSNAMKSLDEKNNTIDDLKTVLSTINRTISNIEKKHYNLNRNLTSIKVEAHETNTTLKGLWKSMDNYSGLLKFTNDTGFKIQQLNNTKDYIDNAFNSIGKFTKQINVSLSEMNAAYKPLQNDEWKDNYTLFMKQLESEFQSVKLRNETFLPIAFRTENNNKLYESVKSFLDTERLNRENITPSTIDMNNKLEIANKNGTALEPDLAAIKLQVESHVERGTKLQEQITRLNATLKEELDKFEFLNATLVPTQFKFNATCETVPGKYTERQLFH
ncbi:hypothetical protein DPMN_134116 [Dreissena polymorpha]|uniref:Uncharacterized protein n=1 Tax=Dreissena polymorpha TaxID=45954 RepID=A0A9D4JFI2_DREPO|nr:hypothetical protein DPMN_134116 [Dreissena polymorpha]